MPVPVDHATGSFYLLHILRRWKYADATVGIGNCEGIYTNLFKKEKDMEANASTNAEFVLATLGNDAGMYGAVKMVL